MASYNVDLVLVITAECIAFRWPDFRHFSLVCNYWTFVLAIVERNVRVRNYFFQQGGSFTFE